MSEKKNKSKKVSGYYITAVAAAFGAASILTGAAYMTFSGVDIVVAIRDIDSYSAPLVAEDFTVVEVSKKDKKIFENCIVDATGLIGKVPSENISKGIPIMPSQVIDPSKAEDVNSIVGDSKHRGLYLPVGASGTVNGDVKIGSIVDFYLMINVPNPKPSDPDATEWVTKPFQMSYKVEKMIVNEDGETSIFFEFPMEETSKYLMLKDGIFREKMYLTAVIPNPLHKQVEGTSLEFDEFFNAVVATPDYFTDMATKKPKGNKTNGNKDSVESDTTGSGHVEIENATN